MRWGMILTHALYISAIAFLFYTHRTVVDGIHDRYNREMQAFGSVFDRLREQVSYYEKMGPVRCDIEIKQIEKDEQRRVIDDVRKMVGELNKSLAEYGK